MLNRISLTKLKLLRNGKQKKVLFFVTKDNLSCEHTFHDLLNFVADLLKQDDSFVEKLSTQIIKNVQVKIGEIHIRYEDRVSSLGRPFALGITLHNLSVQTTDANWTKAIKDETSKFIFKELSLEGLSVYWNCDTILFSDKPVSEMLQLFKDGIAAKERKPTGYDYSMFYSFMSVYTCSMLVDYILILFLQCLDQSIHLLNCKSTRSLSRMGQIIPFLSCSLVWSWKNWLFVCMISSLLFSLILTCERYCKKINHKFPAGISKSQYRDIMLLLESMDWMTRAAPYRKYRPFVPSYAGHYKDW